MIICTWLELIFRKRFREVNGTLLSKTVIANHSDPIWAFVLMFTAVYKKASAWFIKQTYYSRVTGNLYPGSSTTFVQQFYRSLFSSFKNSNDKENIVVYLTYYWFSHFNFKLVPSYP